MAFFSQRFGLEVLAILVASIGVLYIYLKHVVYNYWKKRGVLVVEEPVVPVGNLLKTVTGRLSMGEYYRDAYLRLKSNRFFGAYLLYRPTLVVCDLELLRLVLTKDFTNFHDRGMYVLEDVDPLSAHLFSLPGAKWRNLRVKLTPTFTSGKMKYMFNVVKECGDELSAFLEKSAKVGEVIEVKEILARFSTDVIASTAFGIECNSLNNPDAEFRYWGRKFFEPRYIRNTVAIVAPKILEWFKIAVTDKRCTKFFIDTFKSTLAYRRENNVTRRDFLQLLMQLISRGYVDQDEGKPAVHISENKDGKISETEGAAQAFVFFLAGFETSSSAVSYCLYELAIHQDLQEKTHEDIQEGLKQSGGLTYESLNRMPYLHKVVSETLRKYPPFPILNRVCTEDFQIPGSKLMVSKGTPIFIPVLGIHYDPDLYPEPDKFDPERFSEEKIAARNHYAYLPFGEGPRVCIGMRFGLIQTKIALISMLSKYRFKLGPETEVPLKLDPGNLLLLSKDGVHLQIELR